jgi:hypothetical protein
MNQIKYDIHIYIKYHILFDNNSFINYSKLQNKKQKIFNLK